MPLYGQYGNQYGYSGGYATPANATTPTQPIGGTGNITATSTGTSPLSFGVPNLAYADPATLGRLDISSLIYSPAAGGYLTKADQTSGFRPQGGDPAANRLASSFYGYVGSLPTRPIGTPALNQLYTATGRQPTPGPSYNQQLTNFFNTASPLATDLAKKAGFSSTFTGPVTGRY